MNFIQMVKSMKVAGFKTVNKVKVQRFMLMVRSDTKDNGKKVRLKVLEYTITKMVKKLMKVLG